MTADRAVGDTGPPLAERAKISFARLSFLQILISVLFKLFPLKLLSLLP